MAFQEGVAWFYYGSDGFAGQMKESLSSLDVFALVNELQGIVGTRVEKVYHPELEHLVLALRMPREDKRYLHFLVGRWLFISERNVESPAQPSDFAMMLRKRITGAKVKAVRQQGFERIVVLELEKDLRYELVLEIFADGNVILVKDGVIVQPLRSHTWKHRDVRARKPFMFPPAVPDPLGMSSEELRDLITASDTDLVRTLATRLNLGGRYSEETCARAGLERSMRASQITADDARSIIQAISHMRDEVLKAPSGIIVKKGGTVEDVTPIRLITYDGLEHEQFESFSAAIETYVARVPKQESPAPKKTIAADLGKLKRKIAQQEAAVRKLQDEGRELQLLGDSMFANYAEVSEILVEAKRRLGTSLDLSDIEGFVSFNPEDSTLTVRIGGSTYNLDVRGTVESSAEKCYEGAKRARKKLEGVLKALEEARVELQKAERESEKSHQAAPVDDLARPTKRFWFERYRWFISSEGAIVLGGKDARSNDTLVKKHLEAGDRYAHADVHGAPSVIVKMREGVTEKTLLEACEYAVATSRAWNAKIGSAAGYWVLPEQVSKTPQSGEYLAKGAFVIRGKRNYSNKIELKLGIGEIEFEGSRKVMCGPESAVKTHSKKYIIMKPGDMDKDEIAKRLASALRVPIEEVQSVMPPGPVEIVEQVGLEL